MKVAIAGYGVEGKASYQYWRALGHEVTIVDERELSAYDLPYGASAMLGAGVFEELDEFDLVVRTAGLNPKKLHTDNVWSGTREFFAKCPAPIIGITGTKGKGTTSGFIANILKAAGKNVHLVGNIGTPALEVLPNVRAEDVVVYELSSFQLWDLEKSPHVAVVLMIEADHLDVHANMEEYVAAKANIRRHQNENDVCLYHPTNELSATIANLRPGAKRYGTSEDGAVYVNENTFFVQNDPICSTDAMQLPGSHNLENACAAISAARVFTSDNQAIEQGLRAFEGLDHRLKLIAEKAGVKYYDDSIATTPGSAIAALRAFAQPKVIILGGSDKGVDYRELVEVCGQTQTQVIAIGQTGAKIAELCRQDGVEVVELGQTTMSEVVAVAQEKAKPGSVVILSPASASFDMFKNYADRGDQFIEAVSALTDD